MDEAGVDDTEGPNATQVILDLVELLRGICEADRGLDENPRGAALASVTMALKYLQRTAPFVLRLLANDPDPRVASARKRLSAAPGIALARLCWELEDLEKGITGPILSPAREPRRARVPDKTGATRGRRPSQTTTILMLRAEVAMWVQLLYQLGRTLEDAAAEAASMLKDHPILAGVKGDRAAAILGWRTIVQGGGGAAAHYESSLSVATEMFRTLGLPTDTLVKLVHDRLRNLGKP